MKLRDYLRDRAGWIAGILFELIIILVFGMVIQINTSYLTAIALFQIFTVVCLMGFEFQKKQAFYNDVLRKLDELDKKFLLTEMIRKPGFLEGDFFCDVLYEANKSMYEHVSDQEQSVRDFKDYVEMWIHEIKLPISALSLMNYTENMNFRSFRQQVDKISHYVEQILYYVRADTPQNDFLMKECKLEELLNEILIEHKDVLISEKFTISKKNTDISVISDAKWVTFMIGQLLNNSIKYKKGETGFLGFEASDEERSVTFSIEDHGIGVASEDVKRVFEKSFTGKNGREVAASTGMGLYICRKMCEKLGHEIWMESKKGEYTKVFIRFGKDGYYLNK